MNLLIGAYALAAALAFVGAAAVFIGRQRPLSAWLAALALAVFWPIPALTALVAGITGAIVVARTRATARAIR